jgi:DNA-binding HxlR family transcriptional regulator
MAEHGQYCPVAIGTEMVGDRWTILILRELLVGSTRFNEIARGVPRMSRTMLADRLRRLERAGLVARPPSPDGRGAEYRLTPAGADLREVVWALGEWAVRWSFDDPREDVVDGSLLLWRMAQGVIPERVPPGRVVLRVRLTGADPMTAWMVFEDGRATVCLQHPGFEEDVVMRADNVALHRVHAGRIPLGEAMAAGQVRLEGPRALVRALPGWFAWSPFHAAVRRAAGW